MVIVTLVFGTLMVLFGLAGTVFFDHILKRIDATDKQERIYRFILLIIFILGLYLVVMVARAFSS